MTDVMLIDHPNQLAKGKIGHTRDKRVYIGVGFQEWIELTGLVTGSQYTQPALKPGGGGGSGGGGALSVAGLDGVLRAVSGQLLGNASTSDMLEGTNLYYTVPRTVLAGYGASAVGTDAYAITVTGITALAVGDRFSFLADVANTGAATLQVNSLPVVAAAILKQHDVALATGDIEAGQIVTVVWDGTVWQMQSQIALLDHGTFTGLEDDDHTGYAWLAGRTPVDTQTGTRIVLPAGTIVAGTAPLKMTSGPLLTITEPGASEFLTDDYYDSITTPAGVWVSQYPTQDINHVKATLENQAAHHATDPTLSLIGSSNGSGWLADAGTNQRFHIDLGSTKIITRIYYENYHSSGIDNTAGAKNFTFWGSNNSNDFSDLIYVNNGTWVQLTTSQTTFDQHVALNQADPKYIVVTNVDAYQYYAIKFADNYGYSGFLGVRRIVLQTSDDPLVRRKRVLAELPGLTSGRVPFATTNGRLTDDADFTFAANRLTVQVTLPAGTATAGTAPLVFTAGGVVLTTPLSGAVEAAGDLLYYTTPTGPTRKTIAWIDRKLDDFGTPDDNTDLDATTGRHGLLPKLGGGTTNFLRADGTYAAPPTSSASGIYHAGRAGSGTDAYTAGVDPPPTALFDGMAVTFFADVSNTGAATLNAWATGAKDIRRDFDAALNDNDILAGQFVMVAYDSVQGKYQLVNSWRDR
jgi:hypothetical protein